MSNGNGKKAEAMDLRGAIALVEKASFSAELKPAIKHLLRVSKVRVARYDRRAKMRKSTKRSKGRK